MELVLLEGFAAFFLFLHLVRPLFKGLWNLEGVVLLPLLALGIISGIFPAFGFRPECIPLLVFSIFINLSNIPAFLALFSKLQNDDYRDRGLVYTVPALAVFAFSLWTALYFAPSMDLELSGVETLELRDRERDTLLWVRIYRPDGAAPDLSPPPRPLLFLLPPVTGSVQAVDGICGELRDRGFTVLTYSRPGFDSPALKPGGGYERLSLPALYRLAGALGRGLRDARANAYGKALEEGRKEDIEFLLGELAQNKGFQDTLAGTDRDQVFLAGYGAGGAALTSLAGSDDFIRTCRRVKGIIAVESPLLSSLEGEAPPPLQGKAVPFFGALADSLVPRKITGIGRVPRIRLPGLFLVSDRFLQNGTGRYKTIARTLRVCEAPALLAAIPGAGPFDYSDSPRLFPVYSVLFRGAGEALVDREEYAGMAASLMANFAVLVLENENGGEAEGEFPAHDGETAAETRVEIPLVKTNLDGRIHLETGRVWQLRDSGGILRP
ncbi:MAG: hypothetical protein LBQ44_09985 [Treponema sp.]|jgi:hypothetical protein|nr:hypothetical protein [Treponema sp.]